MSMWRLIPPGMGVLSVLMEERLLPTIYTSYGPFIHFVTLCFERAQFEYIVKLFKIICTDLWLYQHFLCSSDQRDYISSFKIRFSQTALNHAWGHHIRNTSVIRWKLTLGVLVWENYLRHVNQPKLQCPLSFHFVWTFFLGRINCTQIFHNIRKTAFKIFKISLQRWQCCIFMT